MGPKPIITYPKTCIICGGVFHRPRGGSMALWNRRKMCSLLCRKIYMKENKIGFQKGHKAFHGAHPPYGSIPWNKGKRFPGGLHGKNYGYRKGFVAWNRGKKMPESTREKVRLARAKQVNIPRGKKHWNWKGGRTELRKRLQEKAVYRNWRTSVFQRDNFTCQICGKRGGRLNADHIKSYASIISDKKIKTVKDALNCDELWDVTNGRTLCIACHQKTDNYGGKAILN